ncbi:MAG: TetR/AcrR family transcriptional regulator [Bacteroidales bacterium]
MDIKERILLESGKLFARYGIRSMTMDALAEDMRISKRTIYEHFRDKDTLLLEVVRLHKKREAEEAHRIIDSCESAIEAMFRIMKRSIQQMRQLNPLFYHDFQKYHPDVLEKLSEHSEIKDYSVTMNLLQTGVRQKVFRSDIHIDIVNRTLHELFNLFNPDSPMIQADYDRKELFDNMIIPYFRGISTEKGQTLLEKHKKILE